MTVEGIDELAAQGFPVYFAGLWREHWATRGLDRCSLRIGQRFVSGGVNHRADGEVRLPCDTLSVYSTGIQAVMYDARAQASTRRRQFGNEWILRLSRRAWGLAAGRPHFLLYIAFYLGCFFSSARAPPRIPARP